MSFHDIVILLGAVISYGVVRLVIGVAKRLFGLKSAVERNQVLLVEAEKRATKAEECLRLAELELAQQGVERPKRIQITPL